MAGYKSRLGHHEGPGILASLPGSQVSKRRRYAAHAIDLTISIGINIVSGLAVLISFLSDTPSQSMRNWGVGILLVWLVIVLACAAVGQTPGAWLLRIMTVCPLGRPARWAPLVRNGAWLMWAPCIIESLPYILLLAPAIVVPATFSAIIFLTIVERHWSGIPLYSIACSTRKVLKTER